MPRATDRIPVYDHLTGTYITRPAQLLCRACLEGHHYRYVACQRTIAPEPDDYPCQCSECGATGRPTINSGTN